MDNEKNMRGSELGPRRRRRRLKKSVRRFLFFICLIVTIFIIYNNTRSEETTTKVVSKEEVKSVENKKIDEESKEKNVVKGKGNRETTIKISTAGDFTLGTDENFAYSDSFVNEATKNGFSYFVKGLNNIFLEDDLSTVNLETTLTDATKKAAKKFRFKGDPSYAKILQLGGIDAVNLANNHIHDYLEQGYLDTIDSLEKHRIGYFGYEHHYMTTIKGIKIGALGYEGWEDTEKIRKQIKKDIKNLRNNDVQIIIIHFHWGTEKQYVPNESQKSLARFAVDNGADLIVGHHPHVIQGMEEYKGKFIVYSLGNFMFGGNRNPSDKDTFVFQQTFHLKNGKLTNKKEINIVPFSISSVSNRNDYQPTLLKGAEAKRVREKIIEASNKINGSKWLVHEKGGEVVKNNK